MNAYIICCEGRLFKVNLQDGINSTCGRWSFQALKGEIEQQEDLDAWIQKKEAFIVDKLCGIELNLGGVKLKCHAHTDERDDFAVLKQSWHKDGKAIHTGVSILCICVRQSFKISLFLSGMYIQGLKVVYVALEYMHILLIVPSFSTGLPDTIIVKGIPSRWLAELRISSKASVLVTHTVFSYFGTIRWCRWSNNEFYIVFQS